MSIIMDMFRKRVGYACNVNEPKTFNEKIQWRKLFDRNELFPRMVDKCEAKVLANEIIPEMGMNETLWVGTSASDMKLKVPCVVKPTAASGRALFIRNEREAGNPEIGTRARKFLAVKYGVDKGEWAYSQVKQRIMVERMELRKFIDVKYLVFNGKVKACIVMRYRGGKISGWTNFDADFKKVNVKSWPYEAVDDEFPVPECDREKGRELAEALSIGLDFVRVDLYYVFEDREFVFGEYTLYPTSGMADYRPKEWDAFLGECWRLPCNSKK